jgi:hypothetical protein
MTKRIKVLTAVKMSIVVFRLERVACLFKVYDGGDTLFQKVCNNIQDYTASQPRRLHNQ